MKTKLITVLLLISVTLFAQKGKEILSQNSLGLKLDVNVSFCGEAYLSKPQGRILIHDGIVEYFDIDSLCMFNNKNHYVFKMNEYYETDGLFSMIRFDNWDAKNNGFDEGIGLILYDCNCVYPTYYFIGIKGWGGDEIQFRYVLKKEEREAEPTR